MNGGGHMQRRCGKGAAIMFTAMVLAGCALVESVIEIEPREEARVTRKAGGQVALASSAGKCGPGSLLYPECASADVISKASSARYDNGPVLKPIKKGQENKSEKTEDSFLVKAVKNWFRTGMQLHSWIANQ